MSSLFGIFDSNLLGLYINSFSLMNDLLTVSSKVAQLNLFIFVKLTLGGYDYAYQDKPIIMPCT